MDLTKAFLTAASTDDHLRSIDRLCKQAPPGDFMECGVLRGGSAAVLIDNANCDRNVYLCDTFGEFPLKGAEDVEITLQPSVGYTIDFVRNNLLKWGVDVDKTVFVKGKFGETLPGLMKEIGGLALVNFDGDWYDSVMEAFPHILPKLVPGGILIIHDYPHFKGLAKAVHKFIDPKELRPFKEAGKLTNAYYIKEGQADGIPKHT